MSIAVNAYAKVNLTLEVLSKRNDGYHEIATVMQTIDLADTLTFEPATELTLTSSRPDLVNDDNLITKAAHALQEHTGCDKGARVHLEKAIPVSGGLGSGSSDGAATLVALNRLWDLALAPDSLEPLAGDLGSDVAFFVRGGTAVARGRGEVIEPLPPVAQMWFVLMDPGVRPLERKTAQMYSLLNPTHFTDGRHSREFIARLERREPVDAAALFNVFEQVAFDAFPGLLKARALFEKAGAARVHLAGAGPTLFALVSSEAEGRALKERLEREGARSWLARTCQPSSGPPERAALC